MGRHYHYRPGSYYVTDDRTGFPQRAENTRMQWNNLRVDESVWEPRQPQDLVKGVKDDQTVRMARPLAPNQFVGPIYVQTTALVNIGSIFIPLNSTAGLTAGDEIGVMLESNILFNTGIASIVTGGILTYDPMPDYVPDGNLVVDYRIAFTGPSALAYLFTSDGEALVTIEGLPLVEVG